MAYKSRKLVSYVATLNADAWSSEQGQADLRAGFWRHCTHAADSVDMSCFGELCALMMELESKEIDQAQLNFDYVPAGAEDRYVNYSTNTLGGTCWKTTLKLVLLMLCWNTTFA